MAFVQKKLASARTRLANERTLLSYYRTAFALWGLSMLVYKLFQPKFFTVISIIFGIAGCVVAIYGTVRFIRLKNRIIKLMEGKPKLPPPPPS